MNGTVEIANATRQNYYVRGEDGNSYYCHFSDLQTPHSLKTVGAGEKVTFSPGKDEQGRLRARRVTPERDTLCVNSSDPIAVLNHDREVDLRVDSLGRIYALTGNQPLSPTEELTDGSLRAYYSGTNQNFGFNLELPKPTSERTIVLLDNGKHVRREGLAKPGHYLLVLEKGGKCRITNLGVRYQERQRGNKNSPRDAWALIERRFETVFDLTRPIAEQVRTSGMVRDNHQFVPALERALELMRAAAEAA